jgi:murein DD-endopeptidase MepM/ murein hydrolase activator NlpD
LVNTACTPLAEHPLADLPGIISDPYRPPPPGHDERHQGVDFSYYRHGTRTTILGVGVQTVLPGRVAAALPDTYPFGNMVIIETPYKELSPELLQRMPISPGESLYSLYAHLQAAPLVALNDPVIACQQIGAVGTSGNSVEPHLHFETRLGPPGATFASMRFYKANATQEEREYYTLWSTSGIFRTFDPMALLVPKN